ncbi:hypothetical protein CUT44_16660 [Streptomyces carminius]|uniref:Uncharacterized protein n=1 Tax=Streptomyces carminius TaxID=2665496 RepID=A0A2M8LXJ7_9ACTN|nr:hypothetical protein CUT44_16660 [Streptomyces carminius]
MIAYASLFRDGVSHTLKADPTVVRMSLARVNPARMTAPQLLRRERGRRASHRRLHGGCRSHVEEVTMRRRHLGVLFVESL